MGATDHEIVHREDQADHLEHAAWLADVGLRSRIVEHAEDLLGYEQVIVAHEQQRARHEAEIAGRERSGSASESTRHRDEHQAFVAKHLTGKERHSALARNQRQVQVVIRRLDKVLHACH